MAISRLYWSPYNEEFCIKIKRTNSKAKMHGFILLPNDCLLLNKSYRRCDRWACMTESYQSSWEMRYFSEEHKTHCNAENSVASDLFT